MENIEFVVKNCKNIKIDFKSINDVINNIDINTYSHWSYDSYFKDLSEREKIIFAFALESLNFCFWPRYNWKYVFDNKYAVFRQNVYMLFCFTSSAVKIFC